MDLTTFRTVQRRARRKERARQRPDPALFALALILLSVAYAGFVLLAAEWWFR